jgi:hypothetical protein
MWGTDWTRATEVLAYQQGVTPFQSADRRSDSGKAALIAVKNLAARQPR